MSTTSSKQRYTQTKEWLSTIKTIKKTAPKTTKRNTYGQK